MEDMPREMTIEEICFLRIVHLLFQVARLAVRDTFNIEFHPTKLKTELNRNYKVLDDLRKKHIIERRQWELMFPISVAVSSEKFDITLMICLLRHLAKITIQDGFPSSSDKSVAADLSRIKGYRNKVMHCDEGTLTNQEFNQYWDEISQAVVRLGGSKYQQQCDDLKKKEMDIKDKVYLDELKHISRPMIPKAVAVNNEKLLEEWSQKDGHVVKTKAIQTLIEAVDEHAVVSIIGPPGCGKSTSAHHVALYLRNTKSYKVIPAKKANDILKYYNPDYHQVFVFDDMCGKYTLNKQKVTEWRDLNRDIDNLTKDKCIKVLATCRSYIFKERIIANTGILSSNCVDLTSEYCCLSEKEKLDIARMFFYENDILALQKSKQYTKYDCFPLLCEFYAKNRKGSIEDFFSSPIEAIISELSRLNDDIDQTNIATLFLFVVYNNCIPITILNSQSDLKQILETIVEHFYDAASLNLVVVKQVLQNQISCFTKISDNIYSMIHDKIFDILVQFFGQKYFELCLEIGHPEVIRDRFQFESILDNSSIQQRSCMIKVPVSLEDSYFDRLYQDICKGRVDNVFDNIQLKNIHFQAKFVRYFKNRDEMRDKLLRISDTESSPLLLVARHGYFPIVEMLIDIGLSVNICDAEGRTPLYFASNGRYKDITELLLENHANANICDNRERSPLHIASVRGFTEIVALLLKEDVMNMSTTNSVSPLYIASASACSEIVALFLKEGVWNLPTTNSVSPLFIASVFGHTDIVKLYLENGFDPNVQTKHKQTPIYAACYLNHIDIVKLLLNVNCNTNMCTESSESPLLVACRYGYTSIVELLLVNGSDPDLCNISADRSSEYDLKGKDVTEIIFDYYDILKPVPAFLNNISEVDLKLIVDVERFVFKTYESPLFIASYMGYIDIVKLLLDYNCNPNLGNNFDESPLYIAVKHGHTKIVELLLKYKADPNLCNKDCVCSLYQAVAGRAQMHQNPFQNMIDTDSTKSDSLVMQTPQTRLKTVKLLLQYNADPNLCDVFCETPLFVASEKGLMDIVKTLLTYNADPNICNNDFESPLFIASKNGHFDTVRVLLDCNAKPSGCKRNIDSPLYIASNMFQRSFFQYHLSEGEPGRTEQYREIVKLLLKHHADPLLL